MNEEPQSTIVMGHIADMKEKLATNTADTKNIKDTLIRIDDNLKLHNALFVTHEEFNIYKESVKDHESRIRYIERNVWKVMGVLALLELALPMILHYLLK